MSAIPFPTPGKSSFAIAYNQKAEESIIGFFLYHPASFPKCRNYLSPDHFFAPGPRNIFRVLCDVADRGESIELETVCRLIEKEDFYTLADALTEGAMDELNFLCDMGTVLRDAATRRKAQVAL